MMDHKLIITTKGGGDYMATCIYHQFENEINAKSLGKNCSLSSVNEAIFFEASEVLPIMIPKYDRVSLDQNADDLEIVIKYQCRNPKEDNGVTLRKYGTFLHYMLKGLEEYVNSKIVLNISNDKEIHLIFGKEAEHVPEFYLMSMYEGENIASLLRGFSYLT